MSTDDARQQKAEGISLDRRISFVAGAWHVHSPSGSKTYKVNPSPSAPSCEGDDFALRGRARKHILGVRKLLERQLKGEPTPAADQVPAPKPRKTYKQKWPQYNSAQEYEKGHVQELLFDLCSAVQEPQRDKPGRRPTPLRQAIFTTAFKVWSTLSCRRYQSDMRAAVRRGYLSQPYSANVVFRCLQDPDTAAVLHDLIRRSALPLKAVETVFAPDCSGFATSKFERCYGEKYSVSRRQCPWVKCHGIAGVKTGIVTAVVIADKHDGDSPPFPELINKTAENFTIEEVPADKAYLSYDNLELVDKLGGTAYIPFKSHSVEGGTPLWDRMYHYFTLHREEFLQHYHARSNVESVFSAVKRKYGDAVRSKSDPATSNAVLAKILCFNLSVVIQAW